MNLQELPKYVGYYCIGGKMGLRFALTKRPRWLSRFLVKWLFEWVWEDAK